MRIIILLIINYMVSIFIDKTRIHSIILLLYLTEKRTYNLSSFFLLIFSFFYFILFIRDIFTHSTIRMKRKKKISIHLKQAHHWIGFYFICLNVFLKLRVMLKMFTWFSFDSLSCIWCWMNNFNMQSIRFVIMLHFILK